MGHVIKNGLDLLGTGTTVRLNPDLGNSIATMVELEETQTGLSDRKETCFGRETLVGRVGITQPLTEQHCFLMKQNYVLTVSNKCVK